MLIRAILHAQPRISQSMLLFGCLVAIFTANSSRGSEADGGVSFWRDVRPILQKNCVGCHQSAKAGGQYLMTSVAGMLKPGESMEAAIVPGKPDESYLVAQITPKDGVAEMPLKAAPLSEGDIDVIRRWIESGAIDDSPRTTEISYSSENPPLYSQPPVITAVDFSGDGKWLAVTGFNEIFLISTADWKLSGRLIGMSERIESVSFSPDNTLLAATGGSPGRYGELQIWNVAEQKLNRSISVTFDTIYGGSWSPDGKLVSVGCSDNSVRAFNIETGEQVLFQGAHNDWVRDTVFSHDGSHLMSVGRDMTCKLTEVATERFIDNVTSITPGALRGGVNAIDRHPQRDEIVVGGSDGQPKVYRVFRQTARQIGDDANLIRELPAMKGRVFSVAVSRDGSRIAAASSLNNQGQVAVYAYDFDGALSDEIKKIEAKRVMNRSKAEKDKLEKYISQDSRQLALIELPETSLYAVAFSADSSLIATAGTDGKVRVYKADGGELVSEFSPAPLATQQQLADAALQSTKQADSTTQKSSLSSASVEGKKRTLPAGVVLQSLEVEPSEIRLQNRYAYNQLLVTGITDDGQRVDVTGMVDYQLHEPIASVAADGLVRPIMEGTTGLQISIGNLASQHPVYVENQSADVPVDFIQDVNPVLSRLGCNQGTCHGSANGKNGFKLSLRGYDPEFDVRGFTDDLAARRVNFASPDDSLMLLKATGGVPHEGGALISQGDPYYDIIRRWIAGGAKLNLEASRVVSIQVKPHNPIVPSEDTLQQIRVVATYADGRQRDVSRESFIETGNMEVAKAESGGKLLALRRGEAAVLARFEGSYAATTLTVMGNRDGFEWQTPETWSQIDELVANKWQRMKIQPSGLSSDAEFMRRVTLDLTGLPPSADDIREFLADTRSAMEKRAELVDRLIVSDAYVEHWTNKWADLLQVNRKFLGPEGAKAFRDYIRQEIAANTPYNEFVSKILTASGSNKDNPAASYYKILREPAETMENTTHLFLGVRFNCNKCHDHPFERWTQDQYYETAAFFAQVGLKKDPASGDQNIGGSAVEGAKPLYEEIYDKPDGDIKHDRTGAIASPKLPFDCDYSAPENASRRQQLSAWLTSPDNPYFARSYVNRLWGYLLGTGIMEPIDDLRAGNPPTNPELLQYLEEEFLRSGFNTRHVIRLIATSRTYGLSVETNRWNKDDATNYSHALARRLPAETLFDSVYAAVGAQTKIPGVAPGTRAAAIPDSGINLPDGFLNNLGRPVRESACECERSNDMQLGAVMALVSGPTVASAISDPDNSLPALVKNFADDEQLIQELYLRILNRPATGEEIASIRKAMEGIQVDHQELTSALAEREAWWVNRKPELEAERLSAIESLNQQIAETTERLKPEADRLALERQQKIDAAQASLNDYEAKLDENLARWFGGKSDDSREWYPLIPAKLEATNNITLNREPDRSIRATGKADTSVYTLEFTTQLRGIRGIRLEALASPDLPGNGPGLPPNGNFVISELELQSRAADIADEAFKPVVLEGAKADFSQSGFAPEQTLDGQKGNQGGWAVFPAFGVSHWMVCQAKQPIDNPAGTVLRLVIHQNHNAKEHLLGKFRISVTTQEGEVGLGLSEDLAAVYSLPAEKRTDAQKNVLNDYLRKTDDVLRGLQSALAEANKPVPPAAELVALQESLEAARQPVPEDAKLVQLRNDVQQSTTQLADTRLTLTQDLAWALINSPAFLFNR